MLLVLLGAFVALGGQFIFERWKAGRRRKVLLLALEEELRAVAFNPEHRSFGGFTSQTFDELFADVALLLPPEPARNIIRYHLRMKHLQTRVGGNYPPDIPQVREMEDMRERLLSELRP